jgi:hypothetical protein
MHKVSIRIEKLDSYGFTKKNLNKFSIQMSISILLKNYFHLKDNKNYVEGICIEIHYICLSKH